VINDIYITEELRNTDVFAAVFFGMVAVIFAVRTELREEHSVSELRWLRFAAIMSAIIGVLLVIRILTVTIVLFLAILDGMLQ
jgi:hypothetical protein